jgi:hypothetical protein
MAKRKKPESREKALAPDEMELEVQVTEEHIEEGRRLGLTGEQVMERAIERALKKKAQH